MKPLRYNTVNSITYKDFQRTKCMSAYKNVHITYVIKFHSRDRPQNYWTLHLIWNFFSHFSISKDSWEYLAFHILVFHCDIETVIFKGLRTRRITIQLRFRAQHWAVSSVLLKEGSQSTHLLFMCHSPTQLVSIIFYFSTKKTLFSVWHWNTLG